MATAVSASQINLTWSDHAANETGFVIERCEGAGCSTFAALDTVGANTTSYSNTGLTASTSYTYRVAATNGAGTSPYSNTTSATTTTPGTTPAAPSSLSGSAVSASQINLTWSDHASNETGFVIERCQGVGCSTFAAVGTVGANVTSYSNTGLTASTSYSYRVAATNGAGTSGYSNTASATTTPGTTPAAPSSLTAAAVSASQINLTWTDHASNETGFVVERCQGAGCSTFATIATLGTNVTSYNNTGLAASTSYSYRVAATNGAGTSAYSNTATATTSGPPPPPPFAIRINTGGPAYTDAAGQAWSADQYFSGGGAYTASVSIAGTVDDVLYQSERWCTSCSYSIPVPNGSYEVVLHFAEIFWSSANERVFDVSIEGTVVIDNLDIAATVGALTALVQTFPATVSDGTLTVSLLASTDNATIEALEVRPAGSGPPPPPSSLSAAAVSASQINLTWSDHAANEGGFVIERCQGAGCSTFAAIATLGANVTSYNNTGLAASTSYSYRVTATNGAGTSVYSNTATATTPGPPPPPPPFPIRINTGGPAYTDAAGQAWSADQYFSGGGAYTASVSIAGTVDDVLYQSERWCTSCSYSIPVPNGSYEVVLHFAEIFWSSANERVFDVSIEGTVVNDNLDIAATVGPLTALVQTFPVTVSDGTVDVSLLASTDNATIEALEVRLAGSGPAPPTALVATAVSASQINLTWSDHAANETGFVIERCEGAGCSTFAALDTVGANTTSYSNTGLTASTSYTYRVAATNGAGTSPYSNTTSATTTTPGTTPAAPSSLSGSAVSASQINLTWSDHASNETGFVIERCQGVGCSTFAAVGTVGANVTSYSNTGLTASTSYSYRVAATNGAGTSGYSNTASATTTPGTTPAAPSSLTAAAVSASQINLTWTDHASNETGFVVERCQGAGCSTFATIATLGTNVTSYNNTGLAASTSYSYRVAATNGVGTSPYSNTTSATTQGNVPPTVSITAPANGATFTAPAMVPIAATASDTGGTITLVEFFQGTTKLGQDATAPYSFSWQNVPVGSYIITARATDNLGAATTSAPVSVNVVPLTAPAAPTQLTGVALSRSRIRLNWSDNSSNESGFRIERSLNGTTFTEIDTRGANAEQYTNSNLIPNTLYYYRVRAYNGAGNSAYSNVISVRTLQ